MNVSKYIIPVLAGLVVGGVIWAATFPGALNNYSDGDIIESDEWNAIEAKIGIDSSANTDSLDWITKHTNSKLGSIYNTATTSDRILVSDGVRWNSTSSLVIDNNGYVGIGTSTPSYLFSVQGNGIVQGDFYATTLYGNGSNLTNISGGSNWGWYGGDTLRPSTTDGTIGIIVQASSTFAATTTFEGGLIVDTNTLYVMADTGQVGIGTVSPTTILDVEKGATTGIRVSGTGGTVGIVLGAYANTITTEGNRDMNYTAQGTGDVQIGTDADTDMNVGSGKLFVNGNTGNVGIGNKVPTSKLTVSGGDIVVSSTGAATTTISSGVSTFAGKITANGGILSTASSTFTGNLTAGNGLISQASSTFTSSVDFSSGTTTGMFLYPAFTYSTTTWEGTTTTIPLGVAYGVETWTGVKCFTNAGTVSLRFGDGTNKMNWVEVSTTVGEVNLSTNNTFTANEKRYVDIGSVATAASISCTVKKSLQ